jgi:hypothetical protein
VQNNWAKTVQFNWEIYIQSAASLLPQEVVSAAKAAGNTARL